ncbi:MAG: ammonia-forming cytochrome c nitrite reductase subunit c552 [Propionibacteriaceae bacterium]|nr:ammonia-forming cytochrome c nitrite reductase subunit c552 [Propionibacteriaceae bacterium]
MSTEATPSKRKWLLPAAIFLVVGGLIAVGVLALLMNIFERRGEGQQPYFKVAEVDDQTYDSAVWGQNFPRQYEGWKATEEMPEDTRQPQEPTATDPRTYTAKSKLAADPRMVTMWQGYAFSVEYNKPRGHAYMLEDQRLVRRITEFNQPGACLNCHTSLPEVLDTMGNGDRAAGWAAMNKAPYGEATEFAKHPVGCIDCHDPQTMALRITRPAFVEGIKEYKAGQGIIDFDVNTMATPQEMRSFVCAQCHVEYYFEGEGKTLTFPWDKGLKADDALAYYDEHGFSDFTHTLTGAEVVKAQHPDFETWAQGVHSKAGVTCADCHMPYKREGAQKITDHQVASPMRTDDTINTACLTCHGQTPQYMRDRVAGLRSIYEPTKDVAFDALTQLIYDIEEATKNGTPEDRIEAARGYQRKAQFFMDYVVSENSEGFHAPEYTNRLLNDVTDASRRGQMALRGERYEPAAPPQAAEPAKEGELPPMAPNKRIN